MNKKVIYIICLIAFIALLIVATIFLNNNMNETANLNNTTNNNNNLENQNTTNINKVSSVLEVNSASFKKEVLESDLPVLIDFYASWCNPCKVLSPIVEKVANENDKIKVVKINVDKVTDISNEYKIYSLPTLVLIKDGAEIDRLIGLSKKEKIENFLTKNNI